MALSNLALPIDIPWKQIAVSPDMMDVTFCDKSFPFDWRSSLAISVYEPQPEDLPDQFCEGKITYIKVTATITGYQPTKDETDKGFTSFPDVPTEDLTRILGQYFGCYGVLLNIAVFPLNATVPAANEQYTFDGKPDSLPNPFTDAGLRFSISRSGNLELKPTSQSGPLALVINTTQLRIDLPASMNVVLKMAIPETEKGSITAYQNGTEVFAAPLATTTGVQDVRINTTKSVTQIVIEESGEGCLLQGLSYNVEERAVTLDDYPHVLDIEPKTRDLYQAATETGEVLTASASSVKTTKSLTHTDSSETGLEMSSTYKSPPTQYGSVEASNKMTQKWGQTDTDQNVTQADASRDRRETQGTTTNLSQMYNLLTGYHSGTNRVVFLMLPRPHILQPTDHRTFVNGLRIIEGVQEFFLVVARPSDIDGLCIEAYLETGHFPENAPIKQPDPAYDQSSETFEIKKYAGAGDVGSPGGHTTAIDTTYTVANGWVVDRTQGDLPGHLGISEIANDSDTKANQSLKNYNYGVASDSSVSVTGTIQGGNIGGGRSANFDRTYKVFTRSENPKQGGDGGPAVTIPAFLTSRGLCVCFKSGDCPEVVAGKNPNPVPGAWIVDEPHIQIDSSTLTGDVLQITRLPAMKELIRGLHYRMATSWRMPTRHAPGEVGFLDSDYFKNEIAKVLPQSALSRQLSEVPGLSKSVIDSFGGGSKVSDALKLDLHAFVTKTGLSVSDAITARQKLLGFGTE